MKSLKAIAFDDSDKANDFKQELRQLNSQSHLMIEDLMVITRNEEGIKWIPRDDFIMRAPESDKKARNVEEPLANIWKNDFPHNNTKADGYDRFPDIHLTIP